MIFWCVVRPLHRFFQPAINLLLGLVLCVAVSLLQPSREFGALAFDYFQIIIRKLPPFLLYLSFEFHPIAFHAIPVHRVTPLVELSVRYFERATTRNVPPPTQASLRP